MQELNREWCRRAFASGALQIWLRYMAFKESSTITLASRITFLVLCVQRLALAATRGDEIDRVVTVQMKQSVRDLSKARML